MLYFLLAAIGVVLLLPTGTKKTGEETEQPQETAARPAGDAGASVQGEMEQRLCDALSQMDGVGAVHVVVTLESTGKKIVEKDVPTRSTTEENKKGEETGSVTSSSQDEATVYEKTQNGAETPYVVSEEYPAVRGVLVIAEGGGNPEELRNMVSEVNISTVSPEDLLSFKIFRYDGRTLSAVKEETQTMTEAARKAKEHGFKLI